MTVLGGGYSIVLQWKRSETCSGEGSLHLTGFNSIQSFFLLCCTSYCLCFLTFSALMCLLSIILALARELLNLLDCYAKIVFPSSFSPTKLWPYIYSFLPATPRKPFLIPSCLSSVPYLFNLWIQWIFPHVEIPSLSPWLEFIKENMTEQNWYCIKKEGMKKCLQEREHNVPVPLILTPISAFPWLI